MNIALNISYVGLNYSGWQVQPNKKTVQGELELAIEKVFGTKIKTTASGRTDALVSAISQVVNFEVETTIPASRIMFLLNEHLPNDIRVTKSYEVENDFNARFSAKTKTYEYHFYFGEVENAYISLTNQFFKSNLNIEKMNEACKYLIGEHDFTSFSAANTEVENKVRIIFSAEIVCENKENNMYKLVISGSGFLYNMVRIIMGTLLDIGQNKYEPNKIQDIINKKDRKFAGKTIDAKGLVFLKVEY